jgi:release factor glutamine methyltransferase
MGLPFHVGPGVLIPRPDTEPLIEWALAWLAGRPDARIVDIGIGSGAIGISLAAHLPASFTGEIIGIDTSEEALEIARSNASNLLPPERQQQMTFTAGSLTGPISEPVDLLLANLPYLTPEQIAENPDLDAEPRLALDGGPDGLNLVRQVINDLPRILSPGGAAGFEIDPSQAETVSSLLQATLPDSTTQVIYDLARLSRHIVVTRS